jgi:hypothetical protein
MKATKKSAKTRGRPFKPGQSGNPNGRRKGSTNVPKEPSLADAIEALKVRGFNHFAAGNIDAARSCFEKMLALAWGANDPERLSSAVDGLFGTVTAEFKKMQNADIVESLFDDADAAYLKHVDLPKDATWDQFRAHYALVGGDLDADRTCEDLASFPPVATAIAAGLEEARS